MNGSFVVEAQGQGGKAEVGDRRVRERLEHAMTDCFEQMVRKKDEDPAYYGPVKDDDGRITDLVKE